MIASIRSDTIVSPTSTEGESACHDETHERHAPAPARLRGRRLCERLQRVAPPCTNGAVRPNDADRSTWTLEVLDWGGRGMPMVFLGGGGSTAHVFDDFAPQFTDSFHVVGITRRGYGASAGSPPPSELDTLVADITAVLDTLGLHQVVLVGHSIAGEEMTRFAEIHASRCAGLVYLDAAYDRSGIDTIARVQPSAPGPRIRASDTVSFASVRALYARVMGVENPNPRFGRRLGSTRRTATAGR